MGSKGKMAQVIPLQSRARLARPATQLKGSAQILFFLGVRYVRMEEPFAALDRRGGECDSPVGADMHGGSLGGGKKRKRRARG